MSPGLAMYFHLLAASFPNLTLGGQKRRASAGLRRVAQAADDPAAASQPLATPAAGGGQPVGAGAAEQGLPGPRAPPSSPPGQSGVTPPSQAAGGVGLEILTPGEALGSWSATPASGPEGERRDKEWPLSEPSSGRGNPRHSVQAALAGSQRASSQRATLQQPSCLRGPPPAPKVFPSSRAGAQGWAVLGTENPARAGHKQGPSLGLPPASPLPVPGASRCAPGLVASAAPG